MMKSYKYGKKNKISRKKYNKTKKGGYNYRIKNAKGIMSYGRRHNQSRKMKGGCVCGTSLH